MTSVMHSQLLQVFNRFTRLSDDEEQLFQELFVPASLKKNEYFLRSGQQNPHIAFLRSGLVRYFVLKENEESTLEFTKEGEFVAEYQSFATQEVSVQSIQAVEDCELLVLTYDGLQRIYEETACGNLLGRRVIEHRFNAMINQLLSIYMHTPEERYRHFLDQYPELTQRVPQYLIASYVGIKPQSLSRIRKRMTTGLSSPR